MYKYIYTNTKYNIEYYTIFYSFIFLNNIYNSYFKQFFNSE